MEMITTYKQKMSSVLMRLIRNQEEEMILTYVYLSLSSIFVVILIFFIRKKG